MALKLIKEINNSGMFGEYWRIAEISLNRNVEQKASEPIKLSLLNVVLELYYNQEARESGKSAIERMGLSYMVSEEDLMDCNIIELAYNKIVQPVPREIYYSELMSSKVVETNIFVGAENLV